MSEVKIKEVSKVDSRYEGKDLRLIFNRADKSQYSSLKGNSATPYI